jgi:hypothetical protein
MHEDIGVKRNLLRCAHHWRYQKNIQILDGYLFLWYIFAMKTNKIQINCIKCPGKLALFIRKSNG